jgi:hypothetical protein
MRRFSFDNRPVDNAVLHSAGLLWTVIGSIAIIATAQVLKFIEFWCFKLKI